MHWTRQQNLQPADNHEFINKYFPYNNNTCPFFLTQTNSTWRWKMMFGCCIILLITIYKYKNWKKKYSNSKRGYRILLISDYRIINEYFASDLIYRWFFDQINILKLPVVFTPKLNIIWRDTKKNNFFNDYVWRKLLNFLCDNNKKKIRKYLNFWTI